MDLDELHFLAVQKLRAKLFESHTMQDYGFLPGSERTMALIKSNMHGKKASLGGLSYAVVHPKFKRIEIRHLQNKTFSIYGFGNIAGSSLDITFHASDTSFDTLPFWLLKVLDKPQK